MGGSYLKKKIIRTEKSRCELISSLRANQAVLRGCVQCCDAWVLAPKPKTRRSRIIVQVNGFVFFMKRPSFCYKQDDSVQY